MMDDVSKIENNNNNKSGHVGADLVQILVHPV